MGRVLALWRWPVKSMAGEPLRATRLDARDVAGVQDLERSVLVTTEATRAALAAELGAELDLRRFRTNVHVELDTEPWAEREWEGRTLQIGDDVVMRLLHPCVPCAIPTRDPATQQKWPELLRVLDARHGRIFGINARVLQAGRIAVGSAVALG